MIRDIRTKIQFLVTIAIFYSTMLYGFMVAYDQSELVSRKTAMTFGIGIAACILNYLLVSLLDETKTGVLKAVNASVVINLLVFIIPIFATSTVMNAPLPAYFILPFKITFMGTLLLPVATLVLIGTGAIWRFTRPMS